MKPELRERREKTFDLLITKGYPYRRVVEQIASNYDISESGVETDIGRMEDWLPKIVEDDETRKDGLVRLREIRKNRQRLHRMADEARKNKDLETELEIRRKIDDSVELDIALSQSLGHTEREATPMENAMEDFATGAMEVAFPDPDSDDGESDDADETDE